MRNLITSLLLFVSIIAFAQEKTVTGTVTASDTKETLPQVTVKVKGTEAVAISDLDGKFNIKVPSGSNTLVFTYVGYAEKEVDVSSLSGELNVIMESADIGLNQVVVSASKKEEKVLDAPASVTVIGTEKIQEQIATTYIDHLQYTPGVDVMKTGIISSHVVVRGFNNIFSTTLMNIIDNRIASVPSLRVNAYQLVPTSNTDIERMEIVRGPGSALYGPNASEGVCAIFTKSPLDMNKKYEVTASVAGGMRAKGDFESDEAIDRMLINPELRAAVKFNEHVGLKVSGSYLGGGDWRYYDFKDDTLHKFSNRLKDRTPLSLDSLAEYENENTFFGVREPKVGDTLIFGSVQYGKPFVADTTRDPEPFDRDFTVQKECVDGRLDFRLNKDIDIILSGGIANASGIELTGLGAGQVKNWRYSYAQARLRWKKLYFQYFLNSSNAGDTYLIPQSAGAAPPHNVQLLIDKSKMHVVQLQHSYAPIEKLNFIYGIDGLFTIPQTEGTINGRFEDEDNIIQIGGYLQGEWDITKKITAVAAARLDYHNEVEGIFVSPRAAIVYKPTPRHTLRATYNRAFDSPSTLNLSLDLSNALIPNGINARGIGNPDGYNYRRDDQGQFMFSSPYATDKSNPWYSYTDNSNNYMFFDSLIAIIEGIAGARIFNNNLLAGIRGPGGTINSVTNVFEDYVKLNESKDFQASTFDFKNLKNTPAVSNQITQTWEIGYKGILFDKLFLTADFYYTKVSDYVSPLTNSTASVMFNPDELAAALGPADTSGLLYSNYENSSPVLKAFLVGALDGKYGSVPNGTAFDELYTVITGAAAQIPNGSITPDNDKVGSDIILTYKNLGTLKVGGMDLGLNYVLNDNITIGAAYSYVTTDSLHLDGAQLGYVALNAPRNKVAATIEYTWKKIGLKSRAAYRWQQGYPANSAVYVGHVQPAHYLDLGFSYTFPKSTGTSIGLDIQNVTNNKHQPFVGTPRMGTLAMLKISQTFGK